MCTKLIIASALLISIHASGSYCQAGEKIVGSKAIRAKVPQQEEQPREPRVYPFHRAEKTTPDAEIKRVREEYNAAVKAKNWKRVDALKKELADMGVEPVEKN